VAQLDRCPLHYPEGKENVARIRPEYAPADPADRISYAAGDKIQCDLMFPETTIPCGGGSARVFPVLVMVYSHSRFIMATMIPTRMTGDLLAGMWELLNGSGCGAAAAGLGQRNGYRPATATVCSRAVSVSGGRSRGSIRSTS
jgi:hypothetical protein